MEYFHHKELLPIHHGLILHLCFVRQTKYTLDSFPLLTSFFFNDLLSIIFQRRPLNIFYFIKHHHELVD